MTLEWYQCPSCKSKHLGRGLLGKAPDSVCADCFKAKQPGELDSSRCIRCPHCGEIEHDDLGEHNIWDEGTHDVWCGHCGKDYEIETQVEISWRSPAIGCELD